MKELIEHIVKSIVNTPDEVVISEKDSTDFPGLIIYSIKVAETDKGVVIGRGGRTINAIRDLVTIAAIRLQKRVKVLVEEGERRQRQETSQDTNLPKEELKGEDMLADDSDIEGLI